MTFAIGGADGSIRIYDWREKIGHGEPIEKQRVFYSRIYIHPRSITFKFLYGSRFLVVGGEGETAVIINLMNSQQVGTLDHQSTYVSLSIKILTALRGMLHTCSDGTCHQYYLAALIPLQGLVWRKYCAHRNCLFIWAILCHSMGIFAIM